MMSGRVRQHLYRLVSPCSERHVARQSGTRFTRTRIAGRRASQSCATATQVAETITRARTIQIIALFTLCFRVVTVFYGQFFDMYQVFLNYMVFWTAPWAAIVVVDYFMRRGRYQADAWMKWGGGAYWCDAGIFWPGVIALLLGIVASWHRLHFRIHRHS